MKKKFKPGDKVTTKTEAVYHDTQESLNGLNGVVKDNSDYPYNIHVEVKLKCGKKKTIGFSEFELSLTKYAFPKQYGSMSSVNRIIKEYEKEFGKQDYHKTGKQFVIDRVAEGCYELNLIVNKKAK